MSRNGIPFLYARGTHYEVGLEMGRTFKTMINDLIDKSASFKDVFLSAYETETGRAYYESVLKKVTTTFPQYVRELQGIADGAEVEFYKLMILHIDKMLPKVVSQSNTSGLSHGCTDICVNLPDAQLLGHTEDTVAGMLGHFYFVSLHIIEDEKEEKFTSLCYAGQLPGYTMAHNHHGLIYGINALNPVDIGQGHTPRTFLTRALLRAQSFEEIYTILEDDGEGAADGCAVNFTFLHDSIDRKFYNIEVAPPRNNELKSLLSVETAEINGTLFHTNIYKRLPVEVGGIFYQSSLDREELYNQKSTPKSKQDMINFLGDNSNEKSPVFHAEESDPISTIACGIFDCISRKWEIYADNPKFHKPIIVLSMD